MLTNEEDSEEQEKPIVQPSWLSKLKLLFKAFPFLGYAYVTSFCTHSSIMSVLSTLTFPSAPFLPRDHYQYYRMLSDAGKVVGGVFGFSWSRASEKKGGNSSGFGKSGYWLRWTSFSCSFLSLHPGTEFCLMLHWLWRCVSSKDFYTVQQLFIVLKILQVSLPCPADRSTALGLMQIALSVSRLTTAVSGFFVEPYLREHCTNQLMLGQFCLARHASRGEWNMNPKCKI